MSAGGETVWLSHERERFLAACEWMKREKNRGIAVQSAGKAKERLDDLRPTDGSGVPVECLNGSGVGEVEGG